jgi:hypothetical protein
VCESERDVVYFACVFRGVIKIVFFTSKEKANSNSIGT